MLSLDYHAQCQSHVRISIKDLNGRFGGELRLRTHPDTKKYPGVSVGTCQLAAGHPDRCEMFVDGTAGTTGPYLGYWMTWEHRSRYDEMQTEYRLDTYPDCCQAQSPYGWHCVRYNNHPGGHAFTIED